MFPSAGEQHEAQTWSVPSRERQNCNGGNQSMEATCIKWLFQILRPNRSGATHRWERRGEHLSRGPTIAAVHKDNLSWFIPTKVWKRSMEEVPLHDTAWRNPPDIFSSWSCRISPPIHTIGRYAAMIYLIRFRCCNSLTKIQGTSLRAMGEKKVFTSYSQFLQAANSAVYPCVFCSRLESFKWDWESQLEIYAIVKVASMSGWTR